MNQFNIRMPFLALMAVSLMLGSCKDRPSKRSREDEAKQRSAKQLNVSKGVPLNGGAQSAPAFHGDTLSVAVHTVELTGTTTHLWGYEIFTGDSLMIRQLTVPAVTGKYGFASATDAKKIGEMVSHKLKTGQIPSVSIAELQKAGVRYRQYD